MQVVRVKRQDDGTDFDGMGESSSCGFGMDGNAVVARVVLVWCGVVWLVCVCGPSGTAVVFRR